MTSLDGLHPTLMRTRVEALLADPDAQRLGIFVVSAFRSIERQRELFDAAVRKYGSVAAARKWVAPPGHSNHGPSLDDDGNKVTDQLHNGKWGGAVDLGIPGQKAVSGQWPVQLEKRVNEIAARHGLYSPMDWEDWHFEPIKKWTPPHHEEPEMTPEERNQLVTDIVDAVEARLSDTKRIPGNRMDRAVNAAERIAKHFKIPLSGG